MKRSLNVNIEGKIQKISDRNPMLPLFEAVVNSIQAIEERSHEDGHIIIKIERESAQLINDLKKDDLLPISGFEIIDNGVGFNDENLDSFCTSDSTHKKHVGGKGVGRFAWLKFFNEVQIKSQFKEEDKCYERSFLFNKKGIDNDEKKLIHENQNITTIRLTGLNPTYQKKMPQQLETLAERLVEHLLSYFATNSCPSITLQDGSEMQTLQTLYRNNFGSHAYKYNIKIGTEEFSAVGLKLYKGNQVHKLLMCADKRVVEGVNLSKYDAILGRKLEDNEGKNFAFWVFIEGDYLNSIVTDDREALRFPDENTDEEDLVLKIKRTDIIKAILPKILKDLDDNLKQIKKTNSERVADYVNTNAPEYRPIIKMFPEKIELINKATDKEIDTELRKIQFDVENKVKADAQALLEMKESSSSSEEEYEKKTTDFLKIINDMGKASLAKYIAQRRSILDILKKRMELDEKKYPLEKAIHELIFPMTTSSDEVRYEDQNLWIIDERLSYHSYLASDKPLKTSPDGGESDLEPDILIFNRPIALNNQSGVGSVFESIEIIEFKRPGRDDYTDAENPVLQIFKYIEAIKENKEKNFKGRPIEVSTNTHYYCYIICDITEKLRKILKRMGFIDAPDNQGLFHFAQNHNAYIEVMSYNKMLRLAEQRNRILFDKLGIK